ncbi:MAG: addiction module protein [Myxococcaceae bacterium]|nr:addiction module protein [Myxococcaceae bacterium]MCI0669466.1 addiction module protein [Myxococcaceae bacterium]
MNAEQIEAEALKLRRHERARLAEALLSSLDDDSEIDQAWDREADERYQRYLAGHEPTLSADEALAMLRDERKR